jgi:hypothetical protein
MADCDRLETGQSGFEQAPFVVTLGFMIVCVTEVSLHAGNPVGKSAYSPLYSGLDEADDIFTPCDVIVCMNLNLHEFTPLTTPFLDRRNPNYQITLSIPIRHEMVEPHREPAAGSLS